MEAAIVGRTAELALVTELLEDSGTRMRALLIDGESGMGKTTLWLRGVEEARDGSTVLVARPAEGETSLPFAALGDLLEPVPDDGASELPDAQRTALDLALQRAPAGEPAIAKTEAFVDAPLIEAALKVTLQLHRLWLRDESPSRVPRSPRTSSVCGPCPAAT